MLKTLLLTLSKYSFGPLTAYISGMEIYIWAIKETPD